MARTGLLLTALMGGAAITLYAISIQKKQPNISKNILSLMGATAAIAGLASAVKSQSVGGALNSMNSLGGALS